MTDHKTRVLVIAGGWALTLILLVVLVGLGTSEGTFFGTLAGANGVLFGAMLDALAVERRRRDPAIPAIADDVREPPAAPAPLSVVR